MKNLNNFDIFNIVLPHKGLRNCIMFYNLVTPLANMFSDRYTIVPNVNGTITLSFAKNKITAEVWGASTHPYTIGSEPNRYQHLLLIELKPGGLYQLTGLNQVEFINRQIDLKSISPTLYKSLCNAFEAADTLPELTQLLDEALLSCIGLHELQSELILSTKKIISSGGMASVRELAGTVNYSERHLNRIFCRHMGINIKTFSRIIRLNHVLFKLNTTRCSPTEISAQSGFYDQSHFIQEFKALCGITPENYIKNMSDFSYIKTEV